MSQELKKVLENQLHIERELTGLLGECFDRLFGEYASCALAELQEDIACGLVINGCLQSLQAYQKGYENHLHYRKLHTTHELAKEAVDEKQS